MYRDYIKRMQKNTMVINQDDNEIILELKWLNLYDLFGEFISRNQNLEPSPEAIERGELMDQRRDKQYRELGLTPPAKETGGNGAYLVAYVEPYNRLFVFIYFWGYSKPEDNGYSSQSIDFSEDTLNDVRESVGVKNYLIVKGPLPVFKNHAHAARKLGGVFYQNSRPPAVFRYDAFDDFFADWKKLYGR